LNEVLSATLTEGAAFVQIACNPRTKAVFTARCWYRTILLSRKAKYVGNCRLVGKLSVEHVNKSDSQSQMSLELVRLISLQPKSKQSGCLV